MSIDSLPRQLLAYAVVMVAGCAGVVSMNSCALVPPGTESPLVTPAEAELAHLIQRRLELSRLVAWHKYQYSRPVSDPERETALLESLVRRGEENGVPASRTQRFFRAQFAASRRVQSSLIRSWERGGTLPAWPPLSLEGELRPELTEVSARLVDQLALLGDAPGGRPLRSYTWHLLRGAGFSPQVVREAVAGLP